MKFTKQQIKTIRAALMDAISLQERYIMNWGADKDAKRRKERFGRLLKQLETK